MPPRHQWVPWLLLAVIVLLSAGVRSRMLDLPMERDEGEYAQGGQIILRGEPLYQNLHTMKLPGIHAAYGVGMAVFGQTLRGVRLWHIVVNAATLVMMFLLCRRLFDSDAVGLAAAACLALLLMMRQVQGFWANAEHFVLLPALAGLVVLVRAVDRDRTWLLAVAGLLLGLAPVVKQHGGAFALLGLAWVVWVYARQKRWRRVAAAGGVLLGGLMTPYLLTCAAMAATGTFAEFWYWTVTYARSYVSLVTPEQAWINFQRRIVPLLQLVPLVWLLAGVGLSALWWSAMGRRRWAFVAGFLALSALAVVPGWHFRPHYFVLALPAVALLAGLGAASLGRLGPGKHSAAARGVVVGVLVVAALGTSLAMTDESITPALTGMFTFPQSEYLLGMEPNEVCRVTYGGNPFPDSVALARVLRERTAPTDRMAVLGSEPQIPFYADRRNVTGFVYMYPMFEEHELATEMQDAMIREVAAARPELLVYVNHPKSWLVRPGANRHLLTWFNGYLKKHYRAIGFVVADGPGAHVEWIGSDGTLAPLPKARPGQRRGPLYMAVYRRWSPGEETP